MLRDELVCWTVIPVDVVCVSLSLRGVDWLRCAASAVFLWRRFKILLLWPPGSTSWWWWWWWLLADFWIPFITFSEPLPMALAEADWTRTWSESSSVFRVELWVRDWVEAADSLGSREVAEAVPPDVRRLLRTIDTSWLVWLKSICFGLLCMYSIFGESEPSNFHPRNFLYNLCTLLLPWDLS